MANNNNYLELLLSLGVDNESSRRNINEYIKSLKTEKVKVELEVEGLGSANKGFNETNKIIEELQAQVKQLKAELKGLGSGSGMKLGIDGLEDFKREIGQSIRSVGDLEKATKRFNGDMTLNYSNVKLPNGIEEKVLKSINATMTDVDGRIKRLTFTPVMDSNGFIKELKEVSESVKNVDFKDFDKKAKKTQDVLNELGRQGNLTVDEIQDFQKKLNALGDIKSVSELEKLNQEIRELANGATHTNKLTNAMANIRNQITPMLSQLQKLSNIDGLDNLGLNKVINELNRLSNEPVKTDEELRKVNIEFKNAEKSAKSFVKEAERIKKVEGEISKLVTKIQQLGNKGTFDSIEVDKLIGDTKKINKSIEAVKELENRINQLANSADKDNKINNAISNISPTVDRLNEKLTIMTNKLGANVDTSKLEKIRNEIQKIGNTELKTIDDIAKLNLQLSQTEKSITQLGVASNATSKYEDSIRKVNRLLEDLERSGYAVEGSVDSFRAKLSNIPVNDLAQVRNLVNDVEKELREAGQQRGVAKLIDEMREKAELLEARMERTKNLFRRTFDPAEAQQAAVAIANIRRQMETISANPLQATTRTMDMLRDAARQANTEVSNFHANSTTAARNSMGVIDSLRVALEKFPIWMLASTMFYSTTRGIQDLTEKVIELDRAFINLQRVAEGDAFEFEGAISRANEEVTKLSGNMTDYLELLTEYARTGKTINESFDLASTTQMLVNISDLDAKEAVDGLTASLIAFRMEASESARVADMINEVDNNFSVTSKIITDGISKASATAATFDVTLEELIGNITAISSQTRESGSIVGNSLKTLYARITTNSSAIKALEGMGIAMEDAEGKAKSASALLGEVAGKWDGLGESQKRNSAEIYGIHASDSMSKLS